jgi:addiction module RelB/DinJ family antitoxin
MANHTTIRLEADKKEEFARLCESMGLTVSGAINLFVAKVIQCRSIPFEVSAPMSLDEKIIAAALKRNPKRISLKTDENGSVVVDKELHPDIYDWAVNG